MGDDVTAPLLAIDVEGRARDRPLVATAIYVEGQVACALAARLATKDALDPRLAGVRALDGSHLVISGPEECLPWIDGARYLGIDPDAPRLRLSTTHAPSLRDGTPLAASLLERALIARLGVEARGPLVVIRGRVIPLGPSRPLDRGLLASFATPSAPSSKEPRS
jgi:hypothetical protein